MVEEIYNIINNSSRIVLSTHEKPDADGLGSAISFFLFKVNKQGCTNYTTFKIS